MPLKLMENKEVVVFSYSSYSVYKQCPQRYYKEKIAKEPIEQKDETFTIPGRIIHDAAAHYFETGSFEYFDKENCDEKLKEYSNLDTVHLDVAYGSYEKASSFVQKCGNNLKLFLVARDKSKKYLSESWFGTYDEPLKITDNFYIQGAADLIECNPNGTALLYDYKTSWNTKHLSSDQLMLYAIAAKIKWNIKVTMSSFFLLPVNKQQYVTFTDDDKLRLLQDMRLSVNDILTKKEELPYTPSKQCSYCPYLNKCIEGIKYMNRPVETAKTVNFSSKIDL